METMTNWLSWRVWVASVVGWAAYMTTYLLPLLGMRSPPAILWTQFAVGMAPAALLTPPLLHFTQRALMHRRPPYAWRHTLLLVARCTTVQTVWLAIWAMAEQPSSPSIAALVLNRIPSFLFQYAAMAAIAAAVTQWQLAAAQRRELLTAQLRALRSQLQPHFLFNTLHAISVATRSDAATATRMLTLLGDLLRQTLRERDGELIALGDEQQMLQPYLELQQLRFADRLRVVVDIPAAVRHAAVPDLLLQPLVENALVHGIEQRPGGGTVRIAARRDGDRLVLEVADDGIGLPQASDAVAFGTGLGATRARLHALFGDRADIVLAAGSAGGTLATLHLPYRELAHAG